MKFILRILLAYEYLMTKNYPPEVIVNYIIYQEKSSNNIYEIIYHTIRQINNEVKQYLLDNYTIRSKKYLEYHIRQPIIQLNSIIGLIIHNTIHHK